MATRYTLFNMQYATTTLSTTSWRGAQFEILIPTTITGYGIYIEDTGGTALLSHYTDIELWSVKGNMTLDKMVALTSSPDIWETGTHDYVGSTRSHVYVGQQIDLTLQPGYYIVICKYLANITKFTYWSGVQGPVDTDFFYSSYYQSGFNSTIAPAVGAVVTGYGLTQSFLDIVTENLTSTKVSIPLSAGADDGQIRGYTQATASLSTSDTIIYLGDSYYFGEFLFRGLNIPKGAIIDYAYLRVNPKFDKSSGLSLRTTAVDASNPSTLSVNDYSNRTPLYDDGLYRWIYNLKATNIKVSTAVQQIVNRNDWSSGNNITIQVAGLGTDSSYLHSKDDTAGTPPSLTVYYTPPTTKTFTIASGVDDGVISAGSFSTYVNYVGFSGLSAKVFQRFANLTIPKGATITSAVFTMYGAGVNLHFDVYADNVDNSVAITSEADFNSRVKTTTKAVWNKANSWAAPQTLDVTGIVSEVIGRSGWTFGNALQLLFYQNSSSNISGDWGGYEGEVELIPTLTITYTGGEEVPAETIIIERSTDQLTWTQIASVSNGTSYDDTTTTVGITYYYRVKKIINTAESLYSTANAIAISETTASANSQSYQITMLVEGGILAPTFTLAKVNTSVKVSFV